MFIYDVYNLVYMEHHKVLKEANRKTKVKKSIFRYIQTTAGWVGYLG